MEIVMDAAALQQFLAREFAQVHGDFEIVSITTDGIQVKLIVTPAHLRPGGTVSGPSMFALADVGMYLAVLSRIGPQALSVTTNCSIDFMRKPAAGVDLICDVVLHKLGRSLAFGSALIYSEGGADTVARASLTYAIPPVK